jgi:hypothetical protein
MFVRFLKPVPFRTGGTTGPAESAVAKPTYYTESNLTGNVVYELAKKDFAFEKFGLEMVLRVLSQEAGSGIVKKHDSSFNTYTHTKSGHNITLNVNGKIIDYFPKS